MKKREITKFRKDYTPWRYGCVSEGLMLAVTFDEKDEVKRRGARWHPDPSGQGGHWWMPASKLQSDNPDTDDLMAWLNHMQMVYDHPGRIVPSKARECVADCPNDPATYEMAGTEGNFVIHHYTDCRLVSIASDSDTPDAWYSEEDGRKQWDSLVASGFFRLSEDSA